MAVGAGPAGMYKEPKPKRHPALGKPPCKKCGCQKTHGNFKAACQGVCFVGLLIGGGAAFFAFFVPLIGHLSELWSQWLTNNL